jgi:hypothetical protein
MNNKKFKKNKRILLFKIIANNLLKIPGHLFKQLEQRRKTHNEYQP